MLCRLSVKGALPTWPAGPILQKSVSAAPSPKLYPGTGPGRQWYMLLGLGSFVFHVAPGPWLGRKRQLRREGCLSAWIETLLPHQPRLPPGGTKRRSASLLWPAAVSDSTQVLPLVSLFYADVALVAASPQMDRNSFPLPSLQGRVCTTDPHLPTSPTGLHRQGQRSGGPFPVLSACFRSFSRLGVAG